MPRQKSLITVIREIVRQEVKQEMSSMMGGLLGGGKKKSVAGKRGPGRPPGSKNKPKS